MRHLALAGVIGCRVSIRTRHFCRVMPTSSPAISGASKGFNPHPAFLPGDARELGPEILALLVSIRTRHFCRVMHVPVYI